MKKYEFYFEPHPRLRVIISDIINNSLLFQVQYKRWYGWKNYRGSLYGEENIAEYYNEAYHRIVNEKTL